jgi:hypothetical protein
MPPLGSTQRGSQRVKSREQGSRTECATFQSCELECVPLLLTSYCQMVKHNSNGPLGLPWKLEKDELKG